MSVYLAFRALPVWPYPEQAARAATYRVDYDRTLRELRAEIAELSGSDAVIGIVADAREVRQDGMLRKDARVRHHGVEVSFTMESGQRVTFHTDRHRGYSTSWQDNLRAIVLGMEALRAVDRYGISETGQQYAGFAALPMGGPDPEKGRRLVESAGGIRQALLRYHPDHGGDPSDFAHVQAYREQVSA